MSRGIGRGEKSGDWSRPVFRNRMRDSKQWNGEWKKTQMYVETWLKVFDGGREPIRLRVLFA